MKQLDPSTPWHDPRWRVEGNNPLQAGLRLQQGWWRQERLGVLEAGRLYPPPKPSKKPRRRNPLVVSMLPDRIEDLSTNLMWEEAVNAYQDAMTGLNAAAGFIYEDHLRRNLLSSQPLCFNIFGYLSKADPNALLPWVREFASGAISVSCIRLEHAPTAVELGELPLGGSAFDAFVEYEPPGAKVGFIGIETKYHEDLAKGLEIPTAGSPRRDKYVNETAIRPWKEHAASELLGHRKNLQFWYNQLLAQRTFELVKKPNGAPRYSKYTEVVVASRHDKSAHDVVATVAAQLADGHEETLRFCAIEDVVSRVTGHDEWKQELRNRYTDFTPIQRYLSARSPLKGN